MQNFCPSENSIFQVPKNCHPEFDNFYDSKIAPIFSPLNPGPSEQTNGFRHLVIAAILLNKSIANFNFTIHHNDKLSKIQAVPLGLRVDLENLCQLIRLEEPSSTLDKIITVSKIPAANSKGKIKLQKWETNMLKKYLKNFSKVETFETFSNFSEVIHLPAGRFEIYPKSSLHSLVNFFESQNLLNISNLGMAFSNNWIFSNIYKLIDDGGVYQLANPVRGKSQLVEYRMGIW